MTEEENEAIEQLKNWREFIINNKGKVNRANDIEFYLRTALNLIQKQQEEIEKLRNKNKDLLRKLRNRVKEVKKLIKYSSYKKEFSRLNTMLEQKNRQIDLMADTILKDTLKLDTYWCNGCSKTIECPYKNPNKCIVQYFVEKAKEV